MTLRASDLQSESDLDSIRNSCDVLVRNKFSWMSSHFSKGGCNISNLISSLVHFCHYTRRTKTILWNFTLCCFEKLKKRKSGRDVPFKTVHSYLKRLVHSAPPPPFTISCFGTRQKVVSSLSLMLRFFANSQILWKEKGCFYCVYCDNSCSTLNLCALFRLDAVSSEAFRVEDEKSNFGLFHLLRCLRQLRAGHCL